MQMTRRTTITTSLPRSPPGVLHGRHGLHSTARARRVKARDFQFTRVRGIFLRGRTDGRSIAGGPFGGPGQGLRLGKRYLPVSALDATHRTMVVKDLFSSASPTYDRLNHLLSFRRDVAWRRETVRRMRFFSTHAFLDIATGHRRPGHRGCPAAPRRDASPAWTSSRRCWWSGGRRSRRVVWTAVSAWSGAMRCRCPSARRHST